MNRSKLHLLRNMAALLLCACAASCSQDDMPQTGGTPLPDGKYPLSLTATVGTPQTRAGGKDQWLGGEEIAVSIGDYTGKYTMDANGNATATGTPYYWQNTDKATVSAWFPCDAQTNVDISDQSQGYAAFDFLYAETEGSYKSPVQLTFSHQMAKVSYTLVKGQGITNTDLDAATVTLLGDKSVTVSGGKITAAPTSQTNEIKPCTDAAAHTGSAVVVPQDMTRKPLIKVSINNNDFIYTPSSEAAGNLKEGLLYQYTVTVNANGIEVTAATGGEWNDGGSEEVVSKEVTQTFSATDLKPGDFFYSDGNWSDGGLRTIYTDGTYRIDAAVAPIPNKTVIGIVFHAGQHDTDLSDYSKPLTENGPTIPNGKVHGYVVALTDVHNDDSDWLHWEWGPNWQYEQRVNASTSADDWNGYSNSLKFHKFVNDNTGWEMKHFPAALACETYGNRTLNQDGNPANGKYDWQKPLAAPGNTSGWFLPSCGQLKYLYQNGSLLSNRMTEIQNSTPTDCSYKYKIKWFSTSWYYWSSTEGSKSYPWTMRFNNGYHYGRKDGTYDVRAVLAF